MQKKNAQKLRHGARLGQHFLTRPEIAGWIADAAALSSNDTVLEIGPGHGILTRELLKRVGKVIAVEKDPSLVTELKQTFAAEVETGRLTLIEQDIRDFDPYTLHPTPYTLIANIPYYITGYIIRKFLTTRHQPFSMVLLVQKEVAERVVAKDGKESLLSLSVKLFGTPSIAHVVKAGAFSPPPKVDSAVLCVEAISRKNMTDPIVEERLFSLLHQAFREKRKQIGHSLRATDRATFKICGVDERTRPEDITIDKWLCLAKHTQVTGS
jgi:16S rRNA (adenine1518-N6/adenine1519-N6)-dimethyltransferase